MYLIYKKIINNNVALSIYLRPLMTFHISMQINKEVGWPCVDLIDEW